MDATAIPADFELIPPVEAAIDALARAGRTDPAARNALWSVLELKVARFLAVQRRRIRAVATREDVEDLAQQAYLVYADILLTWPGESGFAWRFLFLFPRRLRRASGRILGRLDERRALPPDVSWAARPDEPDLLAEVLPLAPFEPGERALLRLHLVDGYKVEEAAALLGWTRRTAYRRWAQVRGRLQRGMAA